MRQIQKHCAMLFVATVALVAAAYDTGSMSCHDIGQFAADTMQAREQGKSKDDVMAKVEGGEYQNPVEKTNLLTVVKLIYGRMGDQLAGPQAAYKVVKRDCDIGAAR